MDFSNLPDKAPAMDLSGLPDKHSTALDLSGLPDQHSSSPFPGQDQALKDLFSPVLKTGVGKSLQDMTNEDAAAPVTSRPFDRNIMGAEASQNLGIAGDFLSAPGNFIPLPVAKLVGQPIGALLEKFAPQIAKGVAKEFRGLNPSWNARLNAPEDTSVLQSAVTHDITPVTPATTDQNPEYQAWLQKNAQASTPESPLMGVPLHPAEEGKAALAQIPEELPGQQGQLGFRGFPQAPVQPPVPSNTPDYLAAIAKYEESLKAPVDQGQQTFDFTQGPSPTPQEVSTPAAPVAPPVQAAPSEVPAMRVMPDKQMVLNDVINRKTLKPTPEAPPVLGEPFGPVRDPGQQTFDFTTPEAPAPTLQELRAKALTAPDAELPGIQQQIQEALQKQRDQNIPDFTNKVIPKPNILQESAGVKPVLPTPKVPKTSPEEQALRARRLELFNLAGDHTPEQEAELAMINRKLTSKQPSAIDDITTIAKGLNRRIGKKGAIGDLGAKPELSPEENAAIQRFREVHSPALKNYLKIQGNTVEKYLAEKLPTFTPTQITNLAHYMTPQKLGESNISLHNMSPENAAKAKQIAGKNFVDLGKSTKGEPLTRAESIGRAGTPAAKDTAEALSSIDTRDAASGMRRLGLEAQQSLEDMVGKNPAPETIQKANDALESFKRAGTAAGRLLQSRKNILANAQEFAEQSRILFENGDITKESMDAIEAGVAQLKQLPKPAQEKFWRGLHELGVNNMLSVMSNFRNITGNTIGAPLAPLTRAVQGGLNMAVGRPVNKLVGAITNGKVKPFKGTEVLTREAGQMVKSYVDNFGTGAKVGGRYFLHENSSNVYRSIQKDIVKTTNDTSLSTKAKASKLLDLNKQKDAVLETLRSGNSSDNFAEQGGLAHRRSIPGTVGYVINTPVRALAAMDQTFRIPMRKGAEDAIKTRIGIKTDTPWQDVKLTPEQIAEGAHEAAYYTFNQALGKVGKGVQAAAQPTSALGYALANVLVFMKNAVNIGKFALDHGALQTGSGLLDPMIGPLLNRAGQAGKHGLDTQALARSATGLGLAYTSYALMKKSGMKFYLGSDPANPAEATQRKVAGLPTGVYATDASGGVHDLSQIYPLTFFFRNMAAWDTAKELAAKGVDPKDAQWDNFKSQADTFLNASTLTGSKDIMTAWDNAMKQADPSDLPADAVDAGTTYLSKQAAARLTSAFLDEVNRMFLDKTQRDPHTPGEYFEARTPGLSQNVPPKLAWTGQPVKRPVVRSPLAEMTVGESNTKNEDPVQKELVRLGIYPSPVAKSQNGVRFTEDERRAVQRKYGPIELDVVKQLMSDPNYHTLPEFMKFSMISDALKAQHIGEVETAGNHALSNMNDYFKLQMERKTKGRSLSGDTSKSDIFVGAK